MSISSLSFIGVYLPLLLLLYFNPFWKGRTLRNVILLIASLGLYACSEAVYVVLLVVSILLNYGLVKLQQKHNARIFGIMAIVFDTGLLLFFKYINQLLSFATTGNSVLDTIVFPIGLSFFTFREISFVVDNMRQRESPQSFTLLEAALYISNFMTMLQGPIGQWNNERPQIESRHETWEGFWAGMFRFSRGLIKKVIIADSLAGLVSTCFQANNTLSVSMAWAGAIAYTIQLYMDFSGYTDMVIGLGKVFGFEYVENFSLPYTAKSICEFWKKWHMSLTSWFTQYLYIPLGGSRGVTTARHIFNLWVVWLCTGMWHGSNLTFIVWGMIYFVFQVIEKYTGLSDKLNKWHLGHIYTMFVVVICWVVFRATSLSESLRYIGTMFGFNHAEFSFDGDLKTIAGYAIPLVLGLILSSSLVTKLKYIKERYKAVSIIENVCIVASFCIAIILLVSKGSVAPMYAGF